MAGLVFAAVSMVAGVVAAWVGYVQLRILQWQHNPSNESPPDENPPDPSNAVPPRHPLGNRWLVPVALIVRGIAWAASYYVSGGLCPLETLADLNLLFAGGAVVMGLALLTIPRRS
ncbi:cell division protein CrgA [Nocardia gipuzkoensis]